jgi:hypothetical protein
MQQEVQSALQVRGYLLAVKRVEPHENFAFFGSIADMDSSRSVDLVRGTVCGLRRNTHNCNEIFCESGSIFPDPNQGFFSATSSRYIFRFRPGLTNRVGKNVSLTQ